MSRAAPFAQWLQGLQWDGKPRLQSWLHKTLHPTVRPTTRRYHHYLRLVGKSVVLGHVARALEPGCRYDHGVLLLGPAGSGKSTLVSTLVGPEFYGDDPIDIANSKGDLTGLAGIAAYELVEMSAFSRSETAAVKAFLSRQVDCYRAPYAASVEEQPRTFIVWATTNAEAVGDGVADGRRLWPVYVQRADLRWLRKHREQVFAEAVHLYRMGTQITPSAHQTQAYIQPEAARWMRPVQVRAELADASTLPREGGAA